jgi:hypothetical protein
VAAFSEDGDSLSQWRAYGPIAIGFDLRQGFGYSTGTRVQPVFYEKHTQTEMLRLFVDHSHLAFHQDRYTYRRADFHLDVSDRLFEIIAFMKDGAFREEKEVRLAYIENADLVTSLGQELAPRLFRVSKGLVLPYVSSSSLALETPERLPITEVVIGPGPQSRMLAKGVREALDEHGYEDARLRMSVVPYRA